MDRKEAEMSLRNDWYVSLNNNGNIIVEHDKVNRFLEACGMGIKALHEPERKKGHWIILSSNEDSTVCKCSVCGEEFVFYEGEYFPNYCGDCGSDMRGEEG